MENKKVIDNSTSDSGCSSGCGCSCCHTTGDTGYKPAEAGAKESGGENYAVLRIAGLDCGDCAQKLQKRIADLPGVKDVKINFGAAKVYVTYSSSQAEIVQCIEAAGYKVVDDYYAIGTTEQQNRWWQDRKNVLTAIAGVLLLSAALSGWLGMPDYIATILYAGSIIIGGQHIVRSAWAALRSFTPDMNALMTIAVLGAIAIGEWSEAATVVFLFAVGNVLQAHTMDKTRRSISSLISLAPRTALVKRGSSSAMTAVEDICLGDIIIVKPGERIAMDGLVRQGSSAVDQSPITGESMPLEKHTGDLVYAGTINQHGALEIQVTKLVNDSTLSKIMHLVEEAQAQKAPSQQIIDVFARYYTPVVMLSAVGLTLIPWLVLQQPFTEWFYRALVLLVIACPCALVISTPVSIIAAIGSASRQGVLIKGGAYLEEIGGIKSLAFDKTGTLTYGRPAVTKVMVLHKVTEEQLLSIAASLEKWSEHPVAHAITTKAHGLPLKTAENFQINAGRGAQAVIDGEKYYIGNRRLFLELGLDLSAYEQTIDAAEQTGQTTVLVGTDQMLYGLITVADAIRKKSAAAVDGLRSAGIGHIVMLTGDNRQVAESVADKVHIQEVYSELLPEDKVSVVQRMRRQYGSVAMVGDGVNDAPALAAANVGIAMGAAGTDSVLETADIALMADDVGKLAYVIELGRSAVAIIKQNIILALFIKLSVITLTVYGLSNLWMAVFADTGAALLVTLNGMRLARK